MIEVIHTPFGQEHPYEQLPEERFPRIPLANQPFTVGIVTRPPNQTQDVKVHYIIEDTGEQQSVTATKNEQWQPEFEDGVGAEFLERIIRIEQDVWQADLKAPPFGKTLKYWIETGDTATEVFEITGRDWQPGGTVQSLSDNSIIVTQHPEEGVAPRNPAIATIEWLRDGTRAYRVRLTFPCAADEQFYGTGERFNALNQRGKILDVRCYEQYKNQGKRTYMPIPFVLSSAGYGLWVKSSRWMQFDFAATDAHTWTIEADLGDDESLALQWFYGDDPFDIIGQFAQMTGPVQLPPKWSFGLWMSSNEWNSQARIEQEVNTSLAHGIQPSVLVIEAWSDETTFYIWNDAEYKPIPGSDGFRYEDFTFPAEGKWTDPKGMVSWLQDHNIKTLLWQVPVLKHQEEPHTQHDADTEFYKQAGYGVHEADGSVHHVRPFWFRGGYIWDMTNKTERDWWLNKRAYLLRDVGIDGFKTDGGEHLWGENVVFADGRTGAEMWNEYPQHYSQAYYTFANTYREALTFSRAGFVGSQRSPLHWAGDENSTWEAFRHSILAGLSAGISGIPFWGWDIGGFSGAIPDAELYLRATAMAIFCPVMQFHSEYNAHRTPCIDRTPWNIQEQTGDERVIPIFRWFLYIRHQLMDYIWQEAKHSAETGQPMMRAAQLMDTQADPYDYFFGRDIYISPIVEPGVQSKRTYLPAGNWRDLWSGESYSGNQWVDQKTPLNQIPVFIRESSNLPKIAVE